MRSQAIELRHLKVTAELYMTLTEAHVGLAGEAGKAGSAAEQQRLMRRAETCIEQSREGTSLDRELTLYGHMIFGDCGLRLEQATSV